MRVAAIYLIKANIKIEYKRALMDLKPKLTINYRIYSRNRQGIFPIDTCV
jgi:hypothetical protein